MCLGYMIHESAQWSDIHNRWFFLPRRVSKEHYSETEDEFRGSNVLLVADSLFSRVEAKEIGEKGDGSRGFSAFQFLPGSNDDIIDGVAIASYLVVFSLSSGKVLLPEHALNGAYKFEGIVFV
ncbi:apyrase domain-containing protein [Ditylenchus destructor]|nr:apyrase domain-containing protein [Ditylenchus destructor]